MDPSASLGQALLDFVSDTLGRLGDRHFPEWDLPVALAGYPVRSDARADLAWLLGLLRAAGQPVPGGAGLTYPAVLRRILRDLDGPGTETFYSYRTAETLRRFGPFSGNPLLEGLTEAARANLAAACDSTHIYDPATGALRGRPSNYWAVLARCEHGRERLGLPVDEPLFRLSLDHSRRLLEAAPEGFPDDDREGAGRYDIYSSEIILFLEPLAARLGPDLWRERVVRHADYFLTIALNDGTGPAWGRSVGLLSPLLALEMAAHRLHLGHSAPVENLSALARRAFRAIRGWFDEDGLVNAHRHRSTERYRGPHRRLQYTLDSLGKLADVAPFLHEVPAVPPEGARADRCRLESPRDHWTSFRPRAGVWTFRDRHLAFQLPVVAGYNADYEPHPRRPGVFESPVDSPRAGWTPRAVLGDEEALPKGLPVTVEHSPGRLSLRYEGWTTDAKRIVPGHRVVTFQVIPGGVRVEEDLAFAETPRGVAIHWPEARRRLTLTVLEGPPHRRWVITQEGVAEWRSAWGELPRLHEIHLPGAQRLRLVYTVCPQPRVLVIPGDHDYLRALYGALPADTLEVVPLEQNRALGDPLLERLLGEVDVLHLGWPEHLFRGPYDAAFRRRVEALVEGLEASPLRVVWTLHNALPHGKPAEIFGPVYQAWARRADAVIHHSRWGEERMRAALPFRADCRHAVIPHGHYGAEMAAAAAGGRASAEAALGLPPCRLRWGVIGRPQPEKRVDLLVEGFLRAAPPDWQLYLTAAQPGDRFPEDPRLVVHPRSRWLDRAEIALQLSACDALLCAVEGDRYLTSGQVADAVGLGLPLVAPDWPFFREVLGDAALYYGSTAEDLARTLAGLDETRLAEARAALEPLRGRYAWPNLARATADLLLSLGLADR